MATALQVFPAAPTTCPLVAIVSFQLPSPQVRASPVVPPSSTAHAGSADGQQLWVGWQGEMDAMLHVFLEWQESLCALLTAQGHFWCDAVDPRTGKALRGPEGGAVYSEVLGAQVWPSLRCDAT